MIYVAAMYAFYAIINAGINIIRYGKYDSPIINAANIICFITALVSMFSLQTAMLTQFGEHSLHENQMVNALTGSIISITILTITIFMVYTSNLQISKESIVNRMIQENIDLHFIRRAYYGKK